MCHSSGCYSCWAQRDGTGRQLHRHSTALPCSHARVTQHRWTGGQGEPGGGGGCRAAAWLEPCEINWVNWEEAGSRRAGGSCVLVWGQHGDGGAVGTLRCCGDAHEEHSSGTCAAGKLLGSPNDGSFPGCNPRCLHPTDALLQNEHPWCQKTGCQPQFSAHFVCAVQRSPPGE